MEEISFSLVYGSKAVIPSEIGIPSFKDGSNDTKISNLN